MPSKADLELIAAAQAQGVTVSPYQLERWRTAGILPRNPRRWSGRGRGSTSTPVESVVEVVVRLGRSAQQGRAHPMTQVLWRFATGEQLPEHCVRAALRRQMDRIVRRLEADAGAGDEGWQVRHDAAVTIARGGVPPSVGEVVDLAQGRESPQESPSRRVIEAATRLMSADADATSEDILEAFDAWMPLSSVELAQVRDWFRRAELAGHDPAAELGALLSVRRLRQLADRIDLEQLQHSMSVLCRVWALHSLILIRALNSIAREHDSALLQQIPKILTQLPTQMAAIERDPMWQLFNIVPTSISTWNLNLAMMGSILVTQPKMLADLESYLKRLTVLGEVPTREEGIG